MHRGGEGESWSSVLTTKRIIYPTLFNHSSPPLTSLTTFSLVSFSFLNYEGTLVFIIIM